MYALFSTRGLVGGILWLFCLFGEYWFFRAWGVDDDLARHEVRLVTEKVELSFLCLRNGIRFLFRCY